jgi:hypothetical protein
LHIPVSLSIFIGFIGLAKGTGFESWCPFVNVPFLVLKCFMGIVEILGWFRDIMIIRLTQESP